MKNNPESLKPIEERSKRDSVLGKMTQNTEQLLEKWRVQKRNNSKK